MQLLQILEKVQLALPADADQTQRSLVADAITQAQIVIDANASKNREAQSLRKENSELKARVDELSGNPDVMKQKDAEIAKLKEIETRYNDTENRRKQEIINQWKKRSEILSIPETDPRFNVIKILKGSITIPEKESQMTPEIAQHNLDILTAVENTGVLKVEGKTVPGKPATSDTAQVKNFSFFT